MTVRLLLAILLLWAVPAAAQETVVTGISADKIALTANFDGSELFVFGAIRRDAPIPPGIGPLDVVISIKGPERSLLVRRKERRFGVWVNTESVRVRQAPSFYAIASTRPLDDILSETERLRWDVGMAQAVRLIDGSISVLDPESFGAALVRLKMAAGTYSVLDDGVKLTEDTLFQARFQMPANLVEGDYATQFFLVRDKAVVSSGETLILVEKTGLERWLYNLSRHQPLLYGLMSVALALFAGWAAAAAFGLMRR